MTFSTPLTRTPDDFSNGSNELDSLSIFKERKKYVTEIFPDGLIKNMADTWGKDRFYGKINTAGNAVLPLGRFLKPLKMTTEGKNFFALNFVSDAWRDLGERLRKLSADGVLLQDSPWAAPEIHKAYVSVNFEYDTYMIKYLGIHIQTFI